MLLQMPKFSSSFQKSRKSIRMAVADAMDLAQTRMVLAHDGRHKPVELKD